MASISAFRALRYDLGHVGSLSDVIAPPYDVIDAELQDKLYKKHPANVIRLELNRDEPGDDETSNRYLRAARFLKNWRNEGVLRQDAQPALYVYHQIFDNGGQSVTRRGFMCRVRLERFGEGNIYPHEETHASAKADRLKLTIACKANLSQIFGLYPDPTNEAQNLLEAAVAEQTPLEAVDHLGVIHRLWPVTDVKTITEVTAVLGPKPIFIADGHHRYETACNYRDQLSSDYSLSPVLRGEGRGEGLPAEHPANFVLMQCVSMDDAGLVVLPTHRLFRGMAPITAGELTTKLAENFACLPAGHGTDLGRDIWEGIEVDGNQGALAFYTAQDDAWTLATLTPEGENRMAKLAAEHSAAWQGLGVAVLHRLVLDELLAAPSEAKPKYVHSVDEVIEALNSGDAVGRDATGQIGQGGRFELAALVMPATVEHIQLISKHGERMPAKSTYFYPKLVSGLVINLLE